MSRDPHEVRKDFIESEMLAGRNPPRIMSELTYKPGTFGNELEKALADSALKTLRILELEKELAAAQEDAKVHHDLLDGLLNPAAMTSRQQGSE